MGRGGGDAETRDDDDRASERAGRSVEREWFLVEGVGDARGRGERREVGER